MDEKIKELEERIKELEGFIRNVERENKSVHESFQRLFSDIQDRLLRLEGF